MQTYIIFLLEKSILSHRLTYGGLPSYNELVLTGVILS